MRTCMPRRAKMKMKRKRRRRRERMEEMALVKASTRFLRLDQYLIIILIRTLIMFTKISNKFVIHQFALDNYSGKNK